MRASWRVEPLAEVVSAVQRIAGPRAPAVVSINGRSSSGKTTLSARLAAALPRSGVLHTDDIAWHHSVLGWGELLRTGILAPVRRGEPVGYRPPPWDERGREGAIRLPAGLDFLIVEGVGSGRVELHDEYDVRIWVETPLAVRDARDADGGGERALRGRSTVGTGTSHRRRSS